MLSNPQIERSRGSCRPGVVSAQESAPKATRSLTPITPVTRPSRSSRSIKIYPASASVPSGGISGAVSTWSASGGRPAFSTALWIPSRRIRRVIEIEVTGLRI